MKTFTTRPAGEKDASKYAEWLKAAAEINLIDPKVYEYPTCNTCVVEADGDPVLMNSFHLVLMMEALAPTTEGVHGTDRARALKSLFESVKDIARISGVKEIWFGCKDERVQKFVERHGIERVPFPMFRMRVE